LSHLNKLRSCETSICEVSIAIGNPKFDERCSCDILFYEKALVNRSVFQFESWVVKPVYWHTRYYKRQALA
jgi:hypothetical protein